MTTFGEKLDREMGNRDIGRIRSGLEIDSKPNEIDTSGGLSYLPEGGYHIVREDHSRDISGMHAHRGVLEEGAHVDHELLIEMVEQELGYSFDEARLAFDPLAYAEEVPNYYAIRDRMVDIHEAGGNISLLADVLGIKRGTLATAIWRQKQRRKHDQES
jgi:hypothetical protein